MSYTVFLYDPIGIIYTNIGDYNTLEDAANQSKRFSGNSYIVIYKKCDTYVIEHNLYPKYKFETIIKGKDVPSYLTCHYMNYAIKIHQCHWMFACW